MARKIVISSGKGGVGKTTVTANLGYQLAKNGQRVALIDADIGLNNLDVATNTENKGTFSMLDVVLGKCRAKQALTQSEYCDNLYCMSCSHTLSDSDISSTKIKEIISEIDLLFDYILIDCPAGIDLGFHRAVSLADESIVVVMPTISSVRDADKVLAILKSYKQKGIYIIVNKIRGDLVSSGLMFSAEEIEETLNAKIIGVIPEDDSAFNGIIDYNSPAEKSFRYISDFLVNKGSKIYDYMKKYSGFWGSIRKEIKKRV